MVKTHKCEPDIRSLFVIDERIFRILPSWWYCHNTSLFLMSICNPPIEGVVVRFTDSMYQFVVESFSVFILLYTNIFHAFE